jgi:heterodisulfide reductase subunit A
VPLKYTIDDKHCIYLTKGKCGDKLLCKEVCAAGAIEFEQKEDFLELEVGTIVVATGYDTLDPKSRPEYGYNGKNVITGLEFERLCNAAGPTGGEITVNGRKPKNVVFIQCVGSREKNGNTYCSRVCCMYTAKQAHLIREKLPDANVTIFYTDIRAFGKGFEEFYTRVQAEGVTYKRRELEDSIQVMPDAGSVVVKAKGYHDEHADLVILATAIVPRKDAKEVVRLLNIQQSADGFLLEAHPKLRPLDTFTDGIFLAGCCQAPKDIPDSVAQASGAASKAVTLLAKGTVETEGIVAKVNEFLCNGCGICVELCPFKAIELKPTKLFGVIVNTASVNDALCKGCGACSAGCRNGAIQQAHFKDLQLVNAIDGLTGRT